MFTTTLLFRDQYRKFSGIFDHKTKNLSFIRMSYILKQLGIKNRYFFLYLNQPELQGIDPYDKTLDVDTKTKIGIECKINPWYYFREVVRIPSTGLVGGSKFILSRANLAMLWCFFNSFGCFVTIPRQMGKTVSVQALQSYIIFVRGNNIISSMFTKDNDLCTDNVEKLRKIRDVLPNYFVNKTRRDKDNTRTIEYRVLNNRYVSYVSQSNEIGAEKIGRGSTVPIVHFDEIVLFNHIDITFPSCMNAMIAAIKDAEKRHQPRGVIMTSTAGNLDVPSGRFSYHLMSESYRFTESLYDVKNREEAEKLIKNSSLAKRVYIEHSFLQLGGTRDELKEIVARSKSKGSDNLQILRDIFNVWTRGNERSPFDSNILEKLKRGEIPPKYTEYRDEYIFRWFREKEDITGSWFKSTPMIVGIDPSESIGNDYTSMVFLNALDGSLVGSMRCNETNIIRFAGMLVRYISKFENILINIERNSTGCVIIDKVIDDLLDMGIDPLERLFNFIVQDNKEDIRSFNRNSLRSGKIRKEVGFRTTGSKERGRNFLFKTVLMKLLKDFIDRINDGILIDEICGIKYKNGRLDHDEGCHDDVLFGYMLAGYVLFYGKHLHKYSFLTSTNREILEDSLVSFKEGKDNKEESYKQIILEISRLEDDITNPKLPLVMKEKLRQRKLQLEKKIPNDYWKKLKDHEFVRIKKSNPKPKWDIDDFLLM